MLATFSTLIRLYHLTILPVFADEAIYIRWSQVMAAEPTLRFLPLSDGKQPLFMWILMFAVNRFSDPLFVGRLISVSTGFMTLIGIVILSYLLFQSRKVSLTAALIYAVSPFSFFFDRMALVDSMLTMFTVWVFIFGLIVAKTKRIDAAMMAGFVLGGSALTKSPALFVGLLYPATYIIAKWSKKQRLKQLMILICLTLITYFLSLLFYNILRLGPNFHLLSSRTADYVYPVSHLWERPLDPLIPYFHRCLQWIFIMGTGWIYILLIFAIPSTNKYFRQFLFLLIWLLVPIFVQSEFAKVMTARYIYYSIPPLFILAASGVQNKRLLGKIYYVLLTIFVLSSFKNDFLFATTPELASLPSGERAGYLEEWTSGTGIKEVSEYIKQINLNNPGKQIVVGTEGYFGTLPDGLQIYLNGIGDITVIGVGLNIKEVPQSLIDSRAFGNTTYLVVNSSRLSGDDIFSQSNVKVLKRYQKANRLNKQTNDYNKYGEYDTLYLFEVISGQ